MNNKKKIFICFLLIGLFSIVLSCENPAAKPVWPVVDGKVKKQKNSYAVSYNANGGEGEMEASVFTARVWGNLPANTFTRESYVFTGWAVSAGGNVEYADKAAVINLAAVGETVRNCPEITFTIKKIIFLARFYNSAVGFVIPN
jgi:hypothetical protein